MSETPQTSSEAHAEAAIATAAPARDGNIAIREEFDAAVAENSRAAFELFIARHPDHPLAEQARERLRDLDASPPAND